MDGLTPDRVGARRGWRSSTRRSAARPRVPEPESAAPSAAAGEREAFLRPIRAHPSGHDTADVGDVADFARQACSFDPSGAVETVSRRRAAGDSVEAILLGLVVPAARHLAARWKADLCRYEEIAIGVLCLQQLLHGLSADFMRESRTGTSDRRALLVSAPAEQGMLGLYMVTEFQRCVAAEFFHRAGWDVWHAPPASRHQLCSLLSAQWFDVIEVTASCEERLSLLPADLVEMRRASRNPGVAIVVGAFCPVDGDAMPATEGADAAATDPRDMLWQAETLVAQRGRLRKRPPR